MTFRAVQSPRQRQLRRAVALCLSLLVVPGQAQDLEPEVRARSLYLQGDYAGAASAYAAAAEQAPALAAEYTLMAAEAASDGGFTALAENLSRALGSHDLNTAQALRRQRVNARSLIARHQAYQALQQLPAAGRYPVWIAPAMELTRADALFALQDPVSAVRTLVYREQFLQQPGELLANRQRLWQGLSAARLPPGAVRDAGQDVIVKGWLELAQALEPGGPSGLQAWRMRYPQHPGQDVLEQIRFGRQGFQLEDYASGDALVAGAGPIALLLPLSGRYGNVAEAVRDGFISAYLSAGRNDAGLRLYDAGSTVTETLTAYARAVQDGAGFIVGPLQKDALAAVAARGAPPVPTLGLNYLDTLAPPGIVQLGLAPEDEARAAARLALQEGHQRALMLLPDSDWGQRVGLAFEGEFTAQGGHIVRQQIYAPGQVDFGPAVRELVSYDVSEARHRALTAVLGTQTVFLARRRQDVDALFIGAGADEARLLVPQLRFYRAGRLPTYGVAVLFEPGTSREFDGLRTCDMPWMLRADTELLPEVTEARALFGDTQTQRPRLFALGADAYTTAAAIQRGDLRWHGLINGMTGQLELKPGGRMDRRVDCARLESGRPQLLGTP